MKTKIAPAMMVTIVAMLAGCTTVYEGKYDADAGWHPAVVKAVGSSQEIKDSAFRDCRETMDQPSVATGRFAQVSYSWHRSRRSRIVPIETGSTLHPGDLVYVNLQDCKAPLPTRADNAR